MNNEDNLLIELLDEDDNPVLFEHVTTIRHLGKEYVVLIPLDEDAEEDTVVILQILAGEPEDEYIAIEDENELLAIYNLYVAQMEDE